MLIHQIVYRYMSLLHEIGYCFNKVLFMHYKDFNIKHASTFQPQIGLRMYYLQMVIKYSYGQEKYCK